MAAIPGNKVGVVNGVPNAGTGDASTIDALMADGGQATLGITTGAAVVTDVAGTLQQYLRGLVKALGSLTNTAGALDVNIKSGVNTNGSTTDSASAPVAFSTEGKAQLGSLTETAPATDTASSGLNGRLQRIAQRITSMIALLPVALGTSGGLKVDGSGTALPVSGSVTGVDQYATHKEVLASQTAAVLGATGAIGDYLAYVTVFPGIAACGLVTILDAAATVGTFAGGATTPLPSLVPFTIQVGAFCTGAGWKITTGTNVTVTAVGKFT